MAGQDQDISTYKKDTPRCAENMPRISILCLYFMPNANPCYLWRSITPKPSWFGIRYSYMKKLLLSTIASVLMLNALQAQVPVNNDCTNAINITVTDTCSGSLPVYTNVNATQSNIGVDNIPTCFNGNPSRDVWFTFTCPDTVVDLRLTLTGVGGANAIENPQIAIYRGDCLPNDLAEYDCAFADLGANELLMDEYGLTPGFTYFVRVSDYSATAAPNWGQFNLCVSLIPEVITIDEGGSTACSGTLADSGGANGDYGPNENFTFTICPNQPTACIIFTLDYYHLDDQPFGATGVDMLTFYDGPIASGDPLAAINGSTGGEFYVDGGGSVCKKIQASSGCMTIVFKSDNLVEFEGFLGSWVCSSTACPPPVNPVVTVPVQVADIVNSIQSAATQVTITDIVCNNTAYGTFTMATPDNALQMDKGIVLSSGRAVDVGFAASYDAATMLGTPGDTELDFLSGLEGGEESYDACIVEMDVFVATDELTFEYVFGSEEYTEFVNSPFGYNDIFAFLVSGPGIVGAPGLNGQKNIALLPGSNTPVQINSVNNITNWEYFRNNQTSPEISYDGLTSDFMGIKKTLTARTDVIPCNTYHLKLAIADRGDATLDSGVFIAEIKGGTPIIEVAFASGIDYFVEGCSGTGDSLIIRLSDPQQDTTTLLTSVGGTATLGVDYTLNLPPVVVFLPGQTSLAFPIAPLTDGITEGTETILISLSNNFGCGTVVYETLQLSIQDELDVVINGGQDTIVMCGPGTEQLEATGAASYFWQPVSAVSNSSIANPTTSPTQDTWIVVTGTVLSCSDKDSIFVQFNNPMVDIVPAEDNFLCIGESVQLNAVNNVQNNNLVWSPPTGLSSTTVPNPIASPIETTDYIATVSINGCPASDTLRVFVDSLPNQMLTLRPAKPIYCPGDTVTLFSPTYDPGSFPAIQIQWLPDGLGQITPDSFWNLVIRAQETDLYTRIIINRGCTDTSSITVPVGELPVITVTANPSTPVCPGTPVQLSATVTPNQSLEWEEQNTSSLSCTECANPIATPPSTTTYTVTTPDADCPTSASIEVIVLAPPALSLSDQTVCVGGSATLNNAPPEAGATYTWSSNPTGFTSNAAQPNITPAQTTTYTVVATNAACSTSATAVITVASATVSAGPDRVLCQGVSLELTATPSGFTTGAYLWQPNGLTTQTINVNPTETTTYTIVYQYSSANCLTSDNVTVTVNPPPSLGSIKEIPDSTHCEGNPFILEAPIAGGSQPFTFTWLENGAVIPNSDAEFIQVSPLAADEPVTYQYQVRVTDAAGCTDESLPISVEVRRCFAIPNAFTPDNDKNNDVFKPLFFGGGLTAKEFSIYNRWGQRIFTSNAPNPVWDGTVDGASAPVDVYVYRLIVNLPDGTERTYTGDVTLLR
jgi:gliding motility-associated-like protein